MDFSFPKLSETETKDGKLPLTFFATVVDRSDTSTSTDPTSINANSAYGFQRNKVPLEKGFSQIGWMRLTTANKNLNGLNGASLRRDITMFEVSQHSTPEDAWTTMNGKVYNLTPYLKYHPGGVQILLGVAGKDCLALFKKHHAWVNAHALLEKCFIGYLEQPSV